MSALPPFLAALGIDDAGQALDERALRRAYARRLKQIDIDAEPQRFQALREALETALQWNAARERGQAAGRPAPLSVPGDAPLAVVRPEERAPQGARADAPEALAEAVFAALRPQVAALPDVAAARAALARALDDARLVMIDARTLFESRLALLLAQGWQPGHQHLLPAAVSAFGWDSDHARLSNFAHAGALLTAAIRDSSVAAGFTEAQRVAIGPLLDRLRDGLPPDPARLGDEVAALQFLVQRVPNWLRLFAPVDPVNARFQMWRDRPAVPPVGPQPQFAQKKRNSDAGVLYAVLVLIVGIVSWLGHWSANPPGAGQRARVSAPDGPGGTDDLEQRQRRADALLAAIRHPQAASTPPPRSPAPDLLPRATPPSTLDQPWWIPDAMKDPVPAARGATLQN